MIKRIRLFTPIALLLVLAVAVSGCAAGQQVTAADVIAKMRETMKTTQTTQGVVDLSVTINKDGIKTLAQGMMGAKVEDDEDVGDADDADDEEVGDADDADDANDADDEDVGDAEDRDDIEGADDADWTTRLPDSASATVKMWKQSPDKARIEVESSTIPGAKGVTLVYDGVKFYAYDPAGNTVYTGTPDKMGDKMGGMHDELLAMLQSEEFEKELDKLIDASDIKMLGTEAVAGLDAYKLDITPKPDAAEKLELPQVVQMQAGVLIKDMHAVLWVDKDRWIPLKVTLEHPNIGQFTAGMSKIELNQPISESQFVLQTPPGAKVVDLDARSDEMGAKTSTLAEAREQATQDGWKLLEPSYVPDNATLIEVLRMPDMPDRVKMMGKGGGFMLNYSSPKVDFSIIQSKGEYQKMLGDGFSGINGMMGEASKAFKDVEVRGVKAKAFSPDGSNWTALAWQEKDNGIWVAIHGKISLDETLKIAEGLK